jgi:hypothetical protein
VARSLRLFNGYWSASFFEPSLLELGYAELEYNSTYVPENSPIILVRQSHHASTASPITYCVDMVVNNRVLSRKNMWLLLRILSTLLQKEAMLWLALVNRNFPSSESLGP